MSFRAKISAIAATAAICTLLAPAALASPGVSHSTVQVTGKQLKGGLLPTSSFLPGYRVLNSDNSGGKLEHGALFHISAMACFKFWSLIGTVGGFGDTAYANEAVAAKSPSAPVQEIFQQFVSQSASTHAAATLFAQIGAKYKSCRTATAKDGSGGTLKETVHSRVAERVGGHQSLLLTEYLTDSKVHGAPLVTVALWTLNGTDIYMINSQLLSVHSPKPALSSLMLKLMPRIRALK